MIGAHLLGSRLTIDVLEHLLQNLYHLVVFNGVAHFPSQVLNIAALPTWAHLLLQRCYSVDQPVGGHTDPG
jgi:hypothetical protein